MKSPSVLSLQTRMDSQEPIFNVEQIKLNKEIIKEENEKDEDES